MRVNCGKIKFSRKNIVIIFFSKHKRDKRFQDVSLSKVSDSGTIACSKCGKPQKKANKK